MAPTISRESYTRTIDVNDNESRRIGRFDCGFKRTRTLDGTEKKVSRYAAELTFDGATYTLRAVKHPLTIHFPNGASITLSPEETIAASNQMKLEVRNAPIKLVLDGVGAHFVWDISTEDSDVTEDESQGEAGQGQAGETQLSAW
jgi:hypothetical protein